jgi:hypothetical protein
VLVLVVLAVAVGALAVSGGLAWAASGRVRDEALLPGLPRPPITAEVVAASIVRPGGRAGVAVRSVDTAWRWNIDGLPAEVADAINIPMGMGVTPGGCADASLYSRKRCEHWTAPRLG